MRILVLTDFSQGANKALEFVRKHFSHAEIKLLHVVDVVGLSQVHTSPVVGGRITMTAVQVQQDMEAEARQRLEEMGGGVVAFGKPADVGLEAAEAWNADMIAVGTAGKKGLERFFMGSVAEQVARRAPVPVLVVGNEDRV